MLRPYGWQALAYSCVGFHKITLHMSSFLLYPTVFYISCLSWKVRGMGGRWPYSCCFAKWEVIYTQPSSLKTRLIPDRQAALIEPQRMWMKETKVNSGIVTWPQGNQWTFPTDLMITPIYIPSSYKFNKSNKDKDVISKELSNSIYTVYNSNPLRFKHIILTCCLVRTLCEILLSTQLTEWWGVYNSNCSKIQFPLSIK